MEKIYFSHRDGSIRRESQLNKYFASGIRKLQLKCAEYFEVTPDMMDKMLLTRKSKRKLERYFFKHKYGRVKW